MSYPHKMWIVNEATHRVSPGKNGTASKRNPRNLVNRLRPTKETDRFRETSCRTSKKSKWKRPRNPIKTR